MQRAIVLITLISLIALAGCSGAPAGTAPGAGSAEPTSGAAIGEAAAITAATTAYVQANSDVQQMRVEVEQVAGDYARARVFPIDTVTDPAWVYLKRESGEWNGLTIGTAFTSETYDRLGIPEELRLTM